MIVRDGSTIYLSGQTAGDQAKDINAQTAACLAKIDDLLAEAGSDRGHVLSALIHLKDRADFAAMNTVWEDWLSDHPKPARTCVCAELARAEVLVEVTVVARVCQ